MAKPALPDDYHAKTAANILKSEFSIPTKDDITKKLKHTETQIRNLRNVYIAEKTTRPDSFVAKRRMQEYSKTGAKAKSPEAIRKQITEAQKRRRVLSKMLHAVEAETVPSKARSKIRSILGTVGKKALTSNAVWLGIDMLTASPTGVEPTDKKYYRKSKVKEYLGKAADRKADDERDAERTGLEKVQERWTGQRAAKERNEKTDANGMNSLQVAQHYIQSGEFPNSDFLDDSEMRLHVFNRIREFMQADQLRTVHPRDRSIDTQLQMQ